MLVVVTNMIKVKIEEKGDFMSISKIRFKGYDNSLERKTIGDITTSFSGGTPKSSNKTYYEGNIPFIRSGEIKSKQTELFISDDALKDSSAKMVEKGDILYALYGATSGEVAISQINGAINQAILAIKPNSGYSSEFIVNYLKKEKDNILEKYLQGGQGNLSAAIVKSIELYLPSLDEQSAIGSLFRTLDDLLASYKDNLANYQSLKATMLSKMSPKAGQSVPEIRLDGFEGDWEIKKFKSISTKRGKSNSKGYDYPAYSVSNQSGLIPQSEQFEGSRLENLEKTSYKIVEPNEFAYNPARINVGSIAFNDLDETVIVSSLYVIFSLDKSINNNYALLFIKSPEFNKEVRRNTEGSVREYLFYENFANIRIPIPPSLEEQQAIGAYFSNLDNLINSYQDKITQLETLKKKLLQDMFI